MSKVNTTDSTAKSVHGTDPQKLLGFLKDRIHNSMYWKIECFGLDAASILDRGIELNT